MTLRRFFPLRNDSGTSVSTVFPTLLNPSWELDMLDWTSHSDGNTAAWSIRTDRATDGYKSAWFTGSGAGGDFGATWTLENASVGAVLPGDGVSAQLDIALSAESPSESQGKCQLYWYDASMTQIGNPVDGLLIRGDTNGAWHTSTVTGFAPTSAAFVKFRVWATANAYGGVLVDNALWWRQKDGPPSSVAPPPATTPVSGGGGGGVGASGGVGGIGPPPVQRF